MSVFGFLVYNTKAHRDRNDLMRVGRGRTGDTRERRGWGAGPLGCSLASMGRKPRAVPHSSAHNTSGRKRCIFRQKPGAAPSSTDPSRHQAPPSQIVPGTYFMGLNSACP